MHSERTLVFASFFMIAFPLLCPAQVSIALDRAVLDSHGDSYVEFSEAGAYGNTDLTPSKKELMRCFPTDDLSYSVCVDFRKTRPTEPPTDIDYHIYTQSISHAGTNASTEYVVVGSPHGDFSDQWSSVKFRLTENGVHTGTIELPLHSTSISDLISLESPPDAGNIELAQSDHKIPFTATNSLKGFGVVIASAELTTDDDDNWLWPDKVRHYYSATFNEEHSGVPPELRIAPVTGFFQVHPNFWQSLISSTHTINSDDASDMATLTIRYNPELGGSPHAKPIKVRIHFLPPWWALFISAILGSILGGLLTLVFPDTWKATTPARTLGSAALLALITQSFGMLLFLSKSSNIDIAGLSLNPTEILPSFGLGILVGLLGIKTLNAFNIPLPTK
jgi:hypothetical protein